MNAPINQNEEMVLLKDDASGPGVRPGEIVQGGALSSHRFTKTALAHPLIRWKDRIIEGDLYQMGDELMLNIYCPKCENSLKISSTRKQMDWDGETISVEPFQCTWESGRGTDGTKDDRMNFGVGLCRWSVGIDKNIAKDA